MNPEDVYSLTAHGKTYQLWTWPGKVRSCMTAGRPYEQPLLEHIYEQAFTGIAVDAGANLGNHTMWLAVVCGLEVWAFEPVYPDVLRQNVDMNSSAAVHVEPYGLSNRSGAGFHAGRGRLVLKPNNSPELPLRTLDSYALDDVAVVKLDIEGMEPLALRGASETIQRCRPVIFSEEWGDDERRAAARVLRPLGYIRTTSFLGKNHATRMARWEPENL